MAIARDCNSMNATITIHKCVNSYVSRLNKLQMARNIFWLDEGTLPHFSEGAGTTEHTRKCRRILKHQSYCPSNIILQVTDLKSSNWKSNPASSQPCTRRKEKLSELKVLWNFSTIIEAASSTACDQGLIKRVHVCWGPALSFFYCADLCYLNI